MPIFKIHHQSNYTVISNELIRDKKLSNQSLGLLVKMLSLPPDWNYSVEGLNTICKDGSTRIVSSLKELKENGYLTVKPVHLNGRINKWEYHIFEQAQKQSDEFTIEDTIKVDNISDPIEQSNISAIDIVPIKEEVTVEVKPVKKRSGIPDEIIDPATQEVITYLNDKTGFSYRLCKTNKDLVKGLLKDKVTVDEMKQVIDSKCSEWLTNPEMKQYLRPATLFGEKFDYYLSQANDADKKKEEFDEKEATLLNRETIKVGKVY